LEVQCTETIRMNIDFFYLLVTLKVLNFNNKQITSLKNFDFNPMKQIITFISFVFFCCSCTIKSNKVNNDSILDTSAFQISDTNKNTILKSSSLSFHLKFDDNKSLMENLHSGWTDTFSISRQNFRLRFDTTSKDHENTSVEQLKNGQWQKLFNLYLSSDEYGKDDINKDGYIDFVKFYHSRHHTYFYNPFSKTLTDTACIMPEEKTIIDEEKFVLFNYYEAIYGNKYQSSQLYTYKERKPYFFYELLLINGNSSKIDKMNLYSYKNGNYDDTIFIKTIAVGQNLKFDYKNYWTKHYKELMDQNQN
jgi:hypothetical protein